MRRNVSDQKGWLVLSTRARQMVVHTGHAVEEEDPQLVIDAILDVTKARPVGEAREADRPRPNVLTFFWRRSGKI